MKKIKYFMIFICLFLLLVGCGKEEKDYGQYLNKIWIMKETTSKEGLISTPFSFCITSIDNKTIEGKFQLGGAIALPEYYSDNSLLYPEELGTFEGSITNGRAQCTFEDKRGDSGELEIIFKGDNCLEVAINIKSIRDSVEELELKEVNTFSPYNIKDIGELDISKEWSFKIELDSWGQVNFVSGKVENPDGRYFPVSYLTNTEGDILYEFHPGYLAGSEISEVSVEDINGDGLKDISITTLFTCYDAEDDYAIKWDSFQIEDGCFYLNKRSDITEGREQKNKITPRDKHIYNSIDAEDYLYKIWVLDESTNEEYVSDFTFVINSVSQNEIKGRVMIYQAHEMEAGKHKRSTTLDEKTSGWDFIGTITENCAKCRFVNGNGQEGSLYIWFLSDGRVEATARYNDDKLNYNIIERSRFSPYNISDLGEEFQLTKSFGVTIDFYGDVYIMCGRFNNLGNGKFFPVAYLTDRNGNIFYKFDANFAIDIVDADIKDFNGDGKTDVKLLTDYEDDELGTPEHIFIQIENGFFEWHMQYSKDRTYY